MFCLFFGPLVLFLLWMLNSRCKRIEQIAEWIRQQKYYELSQRNHDQRPPMPPTGLMILCFIASSFCCVELSAQDATRQLMHLSPSVRKLYRNPDGSCVQCSIGMCGANNGDMNAATLLWDSDYGPAERGGSIPSRVERYCDSRGIRAWSVTGQSVDDTLPWIEWAAKTGRFAAIGAGTQHFQTLYGYDAEKREWYVCNNNSTDRVDRYSHEQFKRLHAESGAWCVILDRPTSLPPIPVKWWN
jgi:hypothetical protein